MQQSSCQPPIHPAVRQCLGKSLTKDDLATLTSVSVPLVTHSTNERTTVIAEQKVCVHVCVRVYDCNIY